MSTSSFGHILKQTGLALDQLVNVLAGWVSWVCGHGCDDTWADETVSAHTGRRCKDSPAWNRWRRLWDAIFFYQDIGIRLRTGAWPELRHCERAYRDERVRAHMPPEYRNP